LAFRQSTVPCFVQARSTMALRLAVVTIASLAAHAVGEGVDLTEKTWDKEVTQRVANGQMVFVKFQSPW